MHLLVATAWLGLAGFAASASGQQGDVPSGEAKCGPEMTMEECRQARIRIDALLKQMDQASAAISQRHAGAGNSLMTSYALAIQAAVTKNWLLPDGLPNATCRVHIVQLTGGIVESATVDSSCPYDDRGRRSVVNAVLRTQNLPYKGFESVFQRNIVLTFFPPEPARTGKNERGRLDSDIPPPPAPPTGYSPAALDLTYQQAHPVQFPREAIAAGHQGSVMVMALVQINGHAEHALVYRSSGYAELDASAVAAASNWMYTPCHVNKLPIACYVRVPVNFSLGHK